MITTTTSPSVSPTLIVPERAPAPESPGVRAFHRAARAQAIRRDLQAETLRHRAELMALHLRAELAGATRTRREAGDGSGANSELRA